jgi:hypothetical protein
MTLRRLDAPVRIDSADFGIFHVFDNSRISAPLALLFSGAAYDLGGQHTMPANGGRSSGDHIARRFRH